MITPRATRLLRVPDLQTMQAVIASAACGAGQGLSARACAVLVPTRSAAEALRQTLENHRLSSASPAIVLPDILTRAELYDQLHRRLPGGPPRLSDFEREVIFRRAALQASDGGSPAPFRLRAGLVVEILGLYDDLRRRNKTVDAFERLMTGSLEPSAAIDRGAERLLRLTRFLTEAFREFERRIALSGRVDEHGLRALLVNRETPPGPRESAMDMSDDSYRHIVVTIADQTADARGLWPVDYDLLARMPGIERLDIVATENVLAAGFHQRVHDHLPGIEEHREATTATMPVLSAPAPAFSDEPVRWFVCRDREEELVEVARMLKRRRGSAPPLRLERTAVVFQRPLPYLYLARQVFPDAQVPYQALDSLPLAAEPFAAALDLVFSFVLSDATRASIVELLGSPHWQFEVDGHTIVRADVALADAFLRAGSDGVRADGVWAVREPIPRALRAQQAAATELAGVASAPAASAQVAALLAFITAHESLPRPSDPWYARHLRARAAVLASLESFGDACLRHDDAPLSPAELVGTLRRWIEGQTFSPRTGSRGVALLDARAAAYADLDEVRLVGLVEHDWPERGQRSVFYPSSLLSQLGWPVEADRLNATRARFRDLLALPKVRVSLSTCTLEDDAVVQASPFLEELDSATLQVERLARPNPQRMFMHEALAEQPVDGSALGGAPRAWLALRASRSPSAGGAFHGDTGAREPAVYAVSRVERYLECPFKYFAAHVLKLPEERKDQEAFTPQERGQFIHEVFEDFFAQWQRAGNGAITTANIDDALELFERVAEARLAGLGDVDRALERTHLLGSAAAPGLAERAFSFEIEQGGQVIERLLEHSLEGEFVFQGAAGPRRVRLRAKADRIDLLADGTLRVIDYKLGKAPKHTRALQLSVYGVCAEQHLDGRHGRSWTLGRAGYVAFREKKPFSELGGSTSLAEALETGQARFLTAIDGIEAGVFPPKPDEPFLCTRCGYASVCRKDYVGDE